MLLYACYIKCANNKIIIIHKKKILDMHYVYNNITSKYTLCSDDQDRDSDQHTFEKTF